MEERDKASLRDLEASAQVFAGVRVVVSRARNEHVRTRGLFGGHSVGA